MPIDTGTASDLDLLHRLNDDYIHSVVHRDVARFREILSDDFLCTNPDGTVIDKSQFLTQTAAPVSLTEFAVDIVSTRDSPSFSASNEPMPKSSTLASPLVAIMMLDGFRNP